MACSALKFPGRLAPGPVCDDLAARAASFRMEAEFLRARSVLFDEEAMRDAYLALADRFLAFGASLEAELITALIA
jgi:hypothetical protein